MSTLVSTQFTLVFAEINLFSSAQDALCGPSLHSSYSSAMRRFWDYVSKRIIDCCPDKFAEEAEELGFTLTDETEDGLKAFFNSLDDDAIETIANWYVSLTNVDEVECFYEICPHDIEIDLDNVATAA